MPFVTPSVLRGYAREPAIPDPPRRVWRDWALVGVAAIAGLLEALLRRDDQWRDLPIGWQIFAVVAFLAVLPSLLVRRTHPLLATIWAFGLAIGTSVIMAIGGVSGESTLVSTVVLLVVPYALYRWGSGRDGLIGGACLVAAGVVGNLTSTDPSLGDWIGGFLVLSVPVELGLVVRYRRTARERALNEAKSLERERLARELHDSVAHHVSAIAVQAQAGRAVAATDPERALAVLDVIEQQASATLTEMRAMVGALRDGDEASLAPQRGVADLACLASTAPGALVVDVTVEDALAGLGPPLGPTIFRIAQESVTNAVRHAKDATRVDVRLGRSGDMVRLTVVDDGVPVEHPPPGGYGLLGMAERASLLGGVLTAGPSDGRGWHVTADLPDGGVGR